MTNTSYAKLIAGLIGAWFILSLSASALHLFSTEPGSPPLPILVAVLTPIILFSVWYWSSKSFREFVLGLNPRTLTIVQAWRIAGYVFVVLYAYHILPGMFALPAGWGDIAIGATAVPVALQLATPNHRKSFILWQILGITDLVVAVSLGALGSFISPQEFMGPGGTATGALTVLPLSLIPTFGVPLFLILHTICIAQARRWAEQPYTGPGERVRSFAVQVAAPGSK
jgi:hypothetical protein